MSSRTAIYTRASPAIPITVEEQVRSLSQFAEGEGWFVAEVYLDCGIVTGKAAERRPGLTALVHAVKRGAYDIVAVHSLGLLGRDLADLLGILAGMKTAGVRFVALHEGIDTDRSNGCGLLENAALLVGHTSFAKRERILEGQIRAREAGVKFGRPRLSENKVKRVKEALSVGKGIRETSRVTGVSPPSVIRLRDGMHGADISRTTEDR